MASMASDTVQQVKDRLSIVDVVGQYVKLERSGTSLKGRCPFHAEKTASFFVSPDRGTYHCFGCGVGGDIFSFVEAIEGLDFKGALKVLAEKAGVQLVYDKPGERDDRARLFELLETATIFFSSHLTNEAKRYLAGRGAQEGTINAFRIGWAGDSWSELSDFLKTKKFSDKEIIDAGLAKKGDRGLIDKFRNRIIFPIADSAGRIVGFSGRTFGEKASPDAPKYLNSPETPLFRKSRILYGFDRAKMAIRKHNFAVLVEGQMDLVMSHQAGWANTVAVSGTAFTQEHAQLVKRMSDNLVLALDADEAGIKAAGRAARAALQGGLNVKVAQLPEGADPADLILKDAEAWRAAIRDSKDIITFLLDVLRAHAKNDETFRRTVEAVVLPFVGDIQSPIEREQHFKEIAMRLGVSQKAVEDSFARVPQMKESALERVVEKAAPVLDDRARRAYGVLLWQRSEKAPLIDIAAYERDLTEALGSLGELETIPSREKEQLIFSAEREYGASSTPEKDMREAIWPLMKVRLIAKLAEMSARKEQADAVGEKQEAARLEHEIMLLTGRLAKGPAGR